MFDIRSKRGLKGDDLNKYKYIINDLNHILKEVHHSEKDKFYNILNNYYLYNDVNINSYLMNLENHLLERYSLFMNRIHTGCKSNDEKIVVLQLLLNKNIKGKKKTLKKQKPKKKDKKKKNKKKK